MVALQAGDGLVEDRRNRVAVGGCGSVAVEPSRKPAPKVANCGNTGRDAWLALEPLGCPRAWLTAKSDSHGHWLAEAQFLLLLGTRMRSRLRFHVRS